MPVNTRGFSLPEMLVTMVISSILLLGAARLLALLQQQQLQLQIKIQVREELQRVSETVAKLIRRAGYCHRQCLDPALQIQDEGRCLLVRWDESRHGQRDTPVHSASDFYGYRLRHNSIETQKGVSRCDTPGWERLSDPQLLVVTDFRLLRDGAVFKITIMAHSTVLPSITEKRETWVRAINLG